MVVKLRWIALGSVLIGALASPASAQCKWCVTPTKCDDVDESAASGCTEWAGGQCENLGICVIVETDDDAQLSPAQAMWTEILASGVDVLELETPIYGRLPFVHLSGRLFGVFDCQGDLAMIAALGRDGRVSFDRPDESMTSVRISDVWARVRSAELELP